VGPCARSQKDERKVCVGLLLARLDRCGRDSEAVVLGDDDPAPFALGVLDEGSLPDGGVVQADDEPRGIRRVGDSLPMDGEEPTRPNDAEHHADGNPSGACDDVHGQSLRRPRLGCSASPVRLVKIYGMEAGSETRYSFGRVHQTFRVTPAMEAGGANHVWSVEEIVGLLG
jgi:hypothetical protein